jgi:signal transduction histidine kinase
VFTDPEEPRSWRARLGGPWFASWPMWSICVGGAWLVVASDLLAANTAAQLGRWLLALLSTTALSAVVMVLIHRLLLRDRRHQHLSAPAVVAWSAAFGAYYGITLWMFAGIFDAATTSPWEVRIIILTVVGMWLLPSVTAALAVVDDERQRRQRELNALVDLQLIRYTEEGVTRDLRREMEREVSDILIPLRERVDEALEIIERDRQGIDMQLSHSLRDGSRVTLRRMSRDLWNTGAVRYPRMPWQRIITSTLRTQPLRTAVLVVVFVLVDGVFALARHASLGLAYATIVSAAIALCCTVANTLMQTKPRFHARWFIAGLVALLLVDAAAAWLKFALWGESVEPLVVVVAMAVTTFIVLITSAFGAWTDEWDHVRTALRKQVAHETVASLARTRLLAEIARDAAKVLHGSVQARLIACAIALETADSREQLVDALASAREVLERPFPHSVERSPAVHTEVRRKVSLWGDACVFRVIISEDVEGLVDPVSVGRIVEEGVTNSIRHGAAHEIDVSVTSDGDFAVIEVVDDGVGPHRGTPGLGTAMIEHATGGQWSLVRDGSKTRLTAHLKLARMIGNVGGELA